MLTAPLSAPTIVKNLSERLVLDAGPNLGSEAPGLPRRWTFTAKRTRPSFRVDSTVRLRGEITERVDGASLELRFRPGLGAGSMTVLGFALVAMSLFTVAATLATGEGPWLPGVGGAALFGFGLVAHRRELDQIKQGLEREVLLCCVDAREASRRTASSIARHEGFALTGFVTGERLAARTEDWALDDLNDQAEALSAAQSWVAQQGPDAVVEVIAMLDHRAGEIVGHVTSAGYEPLR